jgi:hypothetical protein
MSDEPEPLSDDFYVQFTFDNDKYTWDLLRKAGCKINEEGKVKYAKAMFKSVIIETMQALRDGLITSDEMKAYISDLSSGKLTRYKLETILAKLRRDSGG